MKRRIILDNAAVFDRMLDAGRFRNASQVARFLGISPQAISNYRKKRSLPPSLIIRFAKRCKVSVDWLLNGGSGGNGARLAVALLHVPAGPCSSGILSAEETEYVGKLINILRGKKVLAARTVKMNIDTFSSASRHRKS